MQWMKTSILVFIVLWVGVVARQTQEAKKPPPFPLNLFHEATPDDYIGSKECADCHRVWVDGFERSPHASYVSDPHKSIDKIGCESCHGPAAEHLDDVRDLTKIFSFSKSKQKEITLACLRCHGETMGVTHWNRTAHAQADVACTSCHQIHRKESDALKAGTGENDAHSSPRSSLFAAKVSPERMLKGDEVTMCSQCHRKESAEFRMNFHHPLPEGRILCSDCHNVHPNRTELKHTQPYKGKCTTCHMEVAGPFVYEHMPIGSNPSTHHDEDSLCTECHRPHGSNNPALLKAFSRGLCGQCHTDLLANHNPGRTCWDAGCHAAVHGSNSNAFLLRP